MIAINEYLINKQTKEKEIFKAPELKLTNETMDLSNYIMLCFEYSHWEGKLLNLLDIAKVFEGWNYGHNEQEPMIFFQRPGHSKIHSIFSYPDEDIKDDIIYSMYDIDYSHGNAYYLVHKDVWNKVLDIINKTGKFSFLWNYDRYAKKKYICDITKEEVK